MAIGAEYARLHARLTPQKVFAQDLAGGTSFTYAEFAGAVGRFASALLSNGVGRGDRVAVLARNCIEQVILQLGCSEIGAIYVPLSWRLSRPELSALILDAEPKLVLGDEYLGIAGLAGQPIKAFVDTAALSIPAAVESVDPDRPSLILYTSGTSGRPKGVLLTERNLEQTAINFSLLGRVTAKSVFLCDAPMFHVLGIVTNIRPALMQGGKIIVSDGFVPARTNERLGDANLGITHYFCVPQMASALRAESNFSPDKLHELTAVFTGGAPHPAASIRAWLADGISIVDGFGMSEAGTVFGMPLDPQLIATHAGSAGVPGPGIMTRIVRPDGSSCEVGEAGELLLKGENLAKGYWRKPQETQDAFGDDGWFRTGDIARRDREGYYWIVDRRKDMFISGGENVYPAEIEAVLADHPGILECAVIGVPDEKWGEVGCLFLVSRNTAVDYSEVHQYLATRLARLKIPKHIRMTDALPRNGAGKVQKSELRKLR